MWPLLVFPQGDGAAGLGDGATGLQGGAAAGLGDGAAAGLGDGKAGLGGGAAGGIGDGAAGGLGTWRIGDGAAGLGNGEQGLAAGEQGLVMGEQGMEMGQRRSLAFGGKSRPRSRRAPLASPLRLWLVGMGMGHRACMHAQHKNVPKVRANPHFLQDFCQIGYGRRYGWY